MLWTGNLINLVLDPCLIFGLGPFPELGLTGAAVATVTGRSVAVLLQLRYLATGASRIRVRPALLRLRLGVIRRLLRISRGGIVQYLAETGAWVALVRVLALFGDAALAGYTVAIRLVLFTFMPSWGLSNAAATLVGQHLGAKQPEEAERSVWLTARYNAAFLGSVGLVFLAIPDLLRRPFAPDLGGGAGASAEMLRVGAACLRWLGACYGFFAVGLVAIQAFNGAGDTDAAEGDLLLAAPDPDRLDARSTRRLRPPRRLRHHGRDRNRDGPGGGRPLPARAVEGAGGVRRGGASPVPGTGLPSRQRDRRSPPDARSSEANLFESMS